MSEMISTEPARKAVGEQAEGAISLIEQHGLGGLGFFDGCVCCRFSVRYIDVDVSCRKSSGAGEFSGNTVRVQSSSLGVGAEDLVPVARAVVASLRTYDNWSAVRVRFASYEDDKACRCVYCHKQRTDPAAYLCDDCAVKDGPFVGQTIAELYAFPEIEIPRADT